MTELTACEIWSVEARKHGLSYGKYVQAVEHGELPPPPKRKRKDETRRTRACASCGKEFEIKKSIHNGKVYYSQAKYCYTCRVIAQCYNRKKV